MPDLRHGAGAQDRDFGRTSQSRARPYDAAVLDLCRTESADRFSRHVRFNSRTAGPTQFFSSSIELVTACSRDSCGSLGRLAVLPARLGFNR